VTFQPAIILLQPPGGSLDQAPDLSTAAPWKQRFNAPRFLLAYMARANPARGIIIGNQVKSYQVHAWETATGDLRLLTSDPRPPIALDLA